MMRVPVAYAPVAGVSFHGLGPLGYVRYRRDEEARVAVLLKVSLVQSGDTLAIAAPRESSPGEQARFMSRFGPHELAPWKSEIDVFLRGNLESRVERETFVVDVDQWQRRVRAASLGGAVDLDRCFDEGDVPLVTPSPDSPSEGEPFGDERAWAYQAAALRVPADALTATSPVLRLSRQTSEHRVEPIVGGPISFRLGVEAHEREGSVSPLEMVIDTIVFDVEKRIIEISYRGEMVESDAPLERFVVHATATLAAPANLRDPMRAEFAYAVRLDDAKAGDGLAPEMGPDEREIALYATWHDESPHATLGVDEVARISAELSITREPRDVVLERHGLTAYEWNLEEAALAVTLGAAAHAAGTTSLRDDDTTDDFATDDGATDASERGAAEAYATAHAAELARHPTPELEVSEVARITAHLAHRAPERVLEEVGLSLGSWMKIDAELAQRLAGDDAALGAFEDQVAAFDDDARAARDRDMPFLAEET